MGKDKTSLFTDAMVVYIKNMMKSIKKVLKKLEVSKIAGYKNK